MADDLEDNGLSTEVIWLLIVLPVTIYVVLNVVGTIYYSKLKDRKLSPAARGLTLSSVVIGWVCFPFTNMTSPIVWATTKDQ